MKFRLIPGCMVQQLICLGLLISACSWAQAQPVVIGNTINFDGSSYYQAQRVDDLNDAVEGRKPLIVDPGVYNVINLFTGERFEGVEVTANNAERLRRLRDLTVRVEVYSTTAMELFWERVPFSGIQYEVYNESISRVEPVLITDGTSYYASDLEPGRFYRWRIVAVTDQHERIELESIIAQTTIPITEPDPPTQLSVSVYSATAAELFWNKASPSRSSGEVRSNEIRRNGELVATLRGGNLSSYFDDTREPGVRYFYEVTAVFKNGPRKTTGIQSAVWVDPVANPTHAMGDDLPAGLQSALLTVGSLITLEPLREIDAVVKELITVIPRESELLGETMDDDTTTATYACGDDAQLILVYSNERVLPLSAFVDGEGYCTVGSRQISGSFGYRLTFPSDPANFDQNFSMNNVDIRDGLSGSTIQVSQANLRTLTDRPNVSRGFIRDYNQTVGREFLSVSSLSTSLSDTDIFGDPLELNRSITASGVSSRGLERASFQTLNTFSNFVDGRPTRGELLVNGAVGSSFRINADSGDDNTFVLNGDENGSAFGFLISWPEGFSF